MADPSASQAFRCFPNLFDPSGLVGLFCVVSVIGSIYNLEDVGVVVSVASFTFRNAGTASITMMVGV